jgi:hypothetical protein
LKIRVVIIISLLFQILVEKKQVSRISDEQRTSPGVNGLGNFNIANFFRGKILRNRLAFFSWLFDFRENDFAVVSENTSSSVVFLRKRFVLSSNIFRQIDINESILLSIPSKTMRTCGVFATIPNRRIP